jgi:ABC-type Mn2+/Zn2+ transport system permease subunit
VRRSLRPHADRRVVRRHRLRCRGSPRCSAITPCARCCSARRSSGSCGGARVVRLPAAPEPDGRRGVARGAARHRGGVHRREPRHRQRPPHAGAAARRDARRRALDPLRQPGRGHSRITMDGAMAVSLALFFGGGLTLMRVIQTGPFAQRAGLSSYIFGRAAAITSADLRLIAVFAFIALAFLLANWKVFELYSFDAVLAELVGFRGRLVEPLLQATIVLAVVIGLKLVGLILMIAFVVAPASAARQWTRSLEGMVLLAGCFGALASVLGTLLSVLAGDLPTGPVIVLVLTAIVAVSLVLAPRRGLVARAVRRRRERRELASEVRGRWRPSVGFLVGVALLAVVTALACALPGVFLLLRRDAMMTEAVSHAVLPGHRARAARRGQPRLPAADPRSGAHRSAGRARHRVPARHRAARGRRAARLCSSRRSSASASSSSAALLERAPRRARRPGRRPEPSGVHPPRGMGRLARSALPLRDAGGARGELRCSSGASSRS